MTITRVIEAYDPSTPEVANVDELAAVLTHVTTDQKSWEQNSFCTVPDGVDELTESDLKAGVYHDFTLSAEVVESIRNRYATYHLPIANCGTALCVAGHVAVRNGWTFIASYGADSASKVIPTPQVNTLLAGGWHGNDDLDVRDSGEVARQVLNINQHDANALFAGGNTLLDLWAAGYAITGGRLPLPDSLPEARKAWGGISVTNALPTADDVLDAVHLDLAFMTYFRHTPRWVKYVDVDRVLPLLRDTERAAERREQLVPVTGTVDQSALEDIANTITAED